MVTQPPTMVLIGGGCVFQQLTDLWTISDPQTNLLSTLNMYTADYKCSYDAFLNVGRGAELGKRIQ